MHTTPTSRTGPIHVCDVYALPPDPATTFVGTTGDDVLVGTAADERFFGLAGDDVVDGHARRRLQSFLRRMRPIWHCATYVNSDIVANGPGRCLAGSAIDAERTVENAKGDIQFQDAAAGARYRAAMSSDDPNVDRHPEPGMSRRKMMIMSGVAGLAVAVNGIGGSAIAGAATETPECLADLWTA